MPARAIGARNPSPFQGQTAVFQSRRHGLEAAVHVRPEALVHVQDGDVGILGNLP